MKRLIGGFTTFIALILAVSSPAAGQQTPPPSTDIFLVELVGRAGQLKAGKVVNITDRDGYDNQPLFLPDGRSLFYTSIREDRQADIYRYDVAKGASARVTQTAESEYSPTVMPGGKHFSVIRVEADSTQRLWKFPLEGGTPALVLEKVKPVGYHVWIDESTLALFILGTPNTLQVVDARTEKAETITGDIGRSLHKRPRQEKVSFVHKVSAEEWIIKELDLKTRKITPLIKTLPGSEDYVWAPDGAIFMASGSKLFRWDPARDKGWQEVADFAQSGIKAITRLAISPSGDRLALVASAEPKVPGDK